MNEQEQVTLFVQIALIVFYSNLRQGLVGIMQAFFADNVFDRIRISAGKVNDTLENVVILIYYVLGIGDDDILPDTWIRVLLSIILFSNEISEWWIIFERIIIEQIYNIIDIIASYMPAIICYLT